MTAEYSIKIKWNREAEKNGLIFSKYSRNICYDRFKTKAKVRITAEE